eukprot:SAG31_NODE_2373_length_5846_cov_1.932313_1_plen_144_part_00
MLCPIFACFAANQLETSQFSMLVCQAFSSIRHELQAATREQAGSNSKLHNQIETKYILFSVHWLAYSRKTVLTCTVLVSADCCLDAKRCRVQLLGRARDWPQKSRTPKMRVLRPWQKRLKIQVNLFETLQSIGIYMKLLHFVK